MRTHITAYVLSMFSALLIIGCKTATTPSDSGSGTTLTAIKIADTDAPDINSASMESCWNNTSGILTINPEKIGDNFSGSNTSHISIQSVVTSQNIYFLVQYDDPEADYLDQPLHFTGGNPTMPSNWILDSSAHDDGVSFIFEQPASPGTSGSKTFSANGCTMLCHTETSANGAGMYSENNGRYDVWFWHAGKGNGCGLADDEISIGNPVFGMNPDDVNSENYQNNILEENPGFLPFYIAGGTNNDLDKRYFVAEETAVRFGAVNPLTNSAWVAGDRVPPYRVAQPVGSSDYYDVKARGFWSAGKWKVKFQRKLNDGNIGNDVQFASGNTYLFSFAVHNNTPKGNHYGTANQSFTLKLP
jgi:hypothetical protein